MSKLVFTLRDATPLDVADILRLVRGLADYEHLLHEAVATEAEFHTALFGPQPRAYAVLAIADERAVGLAVWYHFRTFTGRPDMFLEDLFVEPAYRGRRIGLALLRHLARRAVAEQCRRIDWRVLNWNQPSIDFYERIGAHPLQDWHVRQLGDAALRALAEGADHG